MKIELRSKERYNGGVLTKRKWGSATITTFWVYVDGVMQGEYKGYGATPGERMTFAKKSFLEDLARGDIQLKEKKKGLLDELRKNGRGYEIWTKGGRLVETVDSLQSAAELYYGRDDLVLTGKNQRRLSNDEWNEYQFHEADQENNDPELQGEWD